MSTPNFPEPVPPASQLATMPFLAAVYGYLTSDGEVDRLRITVHRTMSRDGQGYFQQVSEYLPITDPTNWRNVGRMLPVSTGIIGKAYDDQRIWATKRYASDDALMDDLKKSLEETHDKRSIEKVQTSYLAVPFLGANSKVVLVLYADCFENNFFGEIGRIQHIAGMCNEFCHLFDALHTRPFVNLRNFPLEPGEPVTEEPTLFKRMQIPIEMEPPRFNLVSSFNYEASVA
jgi:hypothetical protein